MYINARIEKKCIACGKLFQAKIFFHKKGQAKFCSPECQHKAQKNGHNFICKICQKKFYRTPSQIKRGAINVCSRKCFKIFVQGSNNPAWKGPNVSLGPLHKWIKYHKPKTSKCELCNKIVPYDLANISGQYKRDINDFRWLCRRCHMKTDGRLIVLKRISKGHKLDSF